MRDDQAGEPSKKALFASGADTLIPDRIIQHRIILHEMETKYNYAVRTNPEPRVLAANEPFGHSVGYMLSQLGQANSREFAELMAAAGLEPRHFAVLSYLSREPGESQQAVAQALLIPVSTMVSLLDAMEEHGWVVRRVHRTDRRTRTLHLTAKGSAVLRRLTAAAWEHEEKTCDGLTADERVRLLELLGRVASNLGVHPLELPDRGQGPGAIGVGTEESLRTASSGPGGAEPVDTGPVDPAASIVTETAEPRSARPRRAPSSAVRPPRP